MCLSRLPSPSMCSLNGDSGGDFFDADGSYNDMTAFAKKNAASAGREWEGHEHRKYQNMTSLFSKYLSLLYQERNHINNDYWLLCFKVAQQLGLPWDPKCLLHWENQKGEEGTCSRQVWSFSLPSCLVYLSFLFRLTPISIPTTLFFTTSLPCSLLDFCISFTLNCPTDYVYPSDRDDAAQDTAATDGGMACTIFLYFCIFQWLLLSLSE